MDLGALRHHSILFSLLVLSDLLLDGEVELPGSLRKLVSLVLLLELGGQAGKEEVGAVEREDCVSVRLVHIEVLEVKTNDFAIVVNLTWLDFLAMAEVDLATDLEVTAGLVVDLGTLGLLALSLGEGTLLVDLMTRSELFANLLGGGDLTTGEPWVADKISDAETLVGVELEHAGDQVLEVLRVEALSLAGGVAVSLPEKVAPVGGEKLVVVVLLVGHGERRMSGVKDEEDNS